MRDLAPRMNVKGSKRRSVDGSSGQAYFHEMRQTRNSVKMANSTRKMLSLCT